MNKPIDPYELDHNGTRIFSADSLALPGDSFRTIYQPSFYAMPNNPFKKPAEGPDAPADPGLAQYTRVGDLMSRSSPKNPIQSIRSGMVGISSRSDLTLYIHFLRNPPQDMILTNPFLYAETLHKELGRVWRLATLMAKTSFILWLP
jgi:hypothetical protein